MTTYCVQIPCFVGRDKPNTTATPDRWLVVRVRADSLPEAVEKVERALADISNNGEEPPP